MRIFLAGASGAIGRRLVPLLLAAGHHVIGTTRSGEKGERAESTWRRGGGGRRVRSEEKTLRDSVVSARPDVVVHQLTDLPQAFGLRDALARNARLRIGGTPNSVAAAQTAGVGRLIAQSIAFAYAGSPEPGPERCISTSRVCLPSGR